MTKQRNLLAIALEVHMTNSGAMERHPQEQQDDIKCLLTALNEWKEGLPRSKAFDDQVKTLLERTILEATLAI